MEFSRAHDLVHSTTRFVRACTHARAKHARTCTHMHAHTHTSAQSRTHTHTRTIAHAHRALYCARARVCVCVCVWACGQVGGVGGGRSSSRSSTEAVCAEADVASVPQREAISALGARTVVAHARRAAFAALLRDAGNSVAVVLCEEAAAAVIAPAFFGLARPGLTVFRARRTRRVNHEPVALPVAVVYARLRGGTPLLPPVAARRLCRDHTRVVASVGVGLAALLAVLDAHQRPRAEALAGRPAERGGGRQAAGRCGTGHRSEHERLTRVAAVRDAGAGARAEVRRTGVLARCRVCGWGGRWGSYRDGAAAAAGGVAVAARGGRAGRCVAAARAVARGVRRRAVGLGAHGDEAGADAGHIIVARLGP